jgi:rhodanese-related sulfurtransferase
MDDHRIQISPQQLYQRIGAAAAPIIIDIREVSAFQADAVLIVGALRRPPDAIESWQQELPADRLVIVYDDGLDAARGIATALARNGAAARALEGGLARWRALGLPTRYLRADDTGRWVTREHPKVDRIACPWLIRRFIYTEARFLYVPPSEVAAVAKRECATPYDVAAAEFGHVDERCSFDAFVRLYAIADPPLDRLALIVRGADTGHPELAPESPLLLKLSQQLAERFPDDHEMLERGMLMYDALYAWCRREVANGR